MTTIVLSLVLSWSVGSLPTATGNFPREQRAVEKVRATRTITGTLVGFESGDYIHAKIRTPHGRHVSFFIGTHGIEYFLAAHKGKRLTLTYQVVETEIPEAGPITVERLISAKAGTMSFEKWWKNTMARLSKREVERKYEPLVQRYTLN